MDLKTGRELDNNIIPALHYLNSVFYKYVFHFCKHFIYQLIIYIKYSSIHSSSSLILLKNNFNGFLWNYITDNKSL